MAILQLRLSYMCHFLAVEARGKLFEVFWGETKSNLKSEELMTAAVVYRLLSIHSEF